MHLKGDENCWNIKEIGNRKCQIDKYEDWDSNAICESEIFLCELSAVRWNLMMTNRVYSIETNWEKRLYQIKQDS